MPTPDGYTRAQIRLHWVVVVLVALQYLLHEGISEAFDQGLRAGQMTLSPPAIGHMAGGLVVLFLVFWRLALRAEHGAPEPPAEEPGWARMAAKLTHFGFYAVLVLLPVTGGLAWGMASGAMSTAHEVLRAVLLAMILAHVGAVLVHQFVWKTGVMNRMKRPVP
jgi:cytochrome b561